MDATAAIQLIKKSRHVGLVLPLQVSHDARASAEALIHLLSSLHIYVGLMTTLDGAQNSAFPLLASLRPLTKEFVISLATGQAPISQLRYDATEDRLDIIFSPASSATLQDHISFREGRVQCDCVIALGVDDVRHIGAAPHGSHPLLFSEAPVIALNISPQHGNYGKINLVDSSLPSLTELTYRFLSSFPDYQIPGSSATLLLSGILSRTRGFAELKDARTLLSSHELIGLGADYATAYSLARASMPLALTPLIGRALARSRMDTEKKTAWFVITQDDFLATHRAPRDIPDVLDRIEKEFPSTSARVLLWQDPDKHDIHAHIAADFATLASLAKKTTGDASNHTFIELPDTYGSFSKAERAAAALLDAVV